MDSSDSLIIHTALMFKRIGENKNSDDSGAAALLPQFGAAHGGIGAKGLR